MAFIVRSLQRGPMHVARRTDAVLLAVALVWGSSYLAAKTATDALPVLTVLFVRYAVSALACGALVAARRSTRTWTREELRLGSVLGVTQAAVLVLETYGVAHTSAANAGLIISLTIVLTPLLDRTGTRTGRLPRSFFLAAGLCVLAVGLLTSSTGLHAPRLGDGLVLAAAFVRAGHVALVGRFTAGRAIRPLHLTAVQTFAGSALFLAPAAGHLPDLARSSAATWTQLVYLALFCSVFAFLAQTWAVQGTSASRASLLLGTEPVWAVAVGVTLGGERLTPWAALGALLMVAGTYWGQAVERRHRAGTVGARDKTGHRHRGPADPPEPGHRAGHGRPADVCRAAVPGVVGGGVVEVGPVSGVVGGGVVAPEEGGAAEVGAGADGAAGAAETVTADDAVDALTAAGVVAVPDGAFAGVEPLRGSSRQWRGAPALAGEADAGTERAVAPPS
ncbi:Permease of the drug/metabolite transporter (DMT) superfamily [Actinacidiphila rubida]|uniref:Permease of the drug/metabolite transporter (DMT) superfamily n=1 Tax=Actinacidiphila rubida TaxID=310780 RepID=A0A1H8EEE8_9ACTN|nr:Permease of the drug/metabolite transporter (DMT) superfamily [Actinacidiphila rubida]